MNKIYIGLSKPVKWKIGAEAIKLWINRPYSHVYIRFISSNPKVPSNIYQASHGMVHFRTFDNFTKDNIVVKEWEIDITDEERVNILASCMQLAGEPYDTFNLLKIFSVDVLNSCGIKLKTFNGRGFICSELVGTIMANQWGYVFTKPLHLVTPDIIDKALTEQVDPTVRLTTQL